MLHRPLFTITPFRLLLVFLFLLILIALRVCLAKEQPARCIHDRARTNCCCGGTDRCQCDNDILLICRPHNDLPDPNDPSL